MPVPSRPNASNSKPKENGAIFATRLANEPNAFKKKSKNVLNDRSLRRDVRRPCMCSSELLCPARPGSSGSCRRLPNSRESSKSMLVPKRTTPIPKVRASPDLKCTNADSIRKMANASFTHFAITETAPSAVPARMSENMSARPSTIESARS